MGFCLEKLFEFSLKSLSFCQCTLAQRFWNFHAKRKFPQPVKGFSHWKQITLLERKLWNQEQIPLLWSFLTLRKSLRSSSTKYITTLCAALDASHTHQIPTVLQVSYCSSHQKSSTCILHFVLHVCSQLHCSRENRFATGVSAFGSSSKGTWKPSPPVPEGGSRSCFC